jgi:hypothetical protein
MRRDTSARPLRVATVLLATTLLSLLGCEKQDKNDPGPYYFLQPQLPIVAPMKLDRAGAKYSVNFWVLPNRETKITYGFFIGFRSILPGEATTESMIDTEKFLRYDDIPLEVKLTKLDAPVEQKIQLFTPPKLVNGELVYLPISNDIATVRGLAGANGGELLEKKLFDPSKHYTDFSVAALQKAEPGYYRLDMQVLKGNPKASDIVTELLVSNYQPGK